MYEKYSLYYRLFEMEKHPTKQWFFSIKDLVKKVLNRLKLDQLHGFFEVWLKKLSCVLGWLFFQTLSLFLQYSDHQIFSDTLNCSKNILWKKMVNIITHFLSYIEDCYRSCETPLSPPPKQCHWSVGAIKGAYRDNIPVFMYLCMQSK